MGYWLRSSSPRLGGALEIPRPDALMLCPRHLAPALPLMRMPKRGLFFGSFITMAWM
jgi:hypothetical protein